MRTLFNKQDKDLVLDTNKLITEIYHETLIQVLKEATRNIPLSDKKKIYIYVNFRGKRIKEDIIKHFRRIINVLNRSPYKESIDGETASTKEIIEWANNNAPGLLKKCDDKIGKQLMHTLAQVAEKGCREEIRKEFNIGIVSGKCFKATSNEAIQAQMYQESGGIGKITRATTFAVNKSGEVVIYKKSNKVTCGKQLDIMIESKYCVVYTTCKALTSAVDGGSRTNEYKADLGGTLLNRKEHFCINGYEKRDDKIVLVVGLIDSRFFNENPKAVEIIQECAGETIGDTFVSDSITLAKFIKMIDIPDLLTDTRRVIAEAFDKLAATL